MNPVDRSKAVDKDKAVETVLDKRTWPCPCGCNNTGGCPCGCTTPELHKYKREREVAMKLRDKSKNIGNFIDRLFDDGKGEGRLMTLKQMTTIAEESGFSSPINVRFWGHQGNSKNYGVFGPILTSFRASATFCLHADFLK